MVTSFELSYDSLRGPHDLEGGIRLHDLELPRWGSSRSLFVLLTSPGGNRKSFFQGVFPPHKGLSVQLEKEPTNGRPISMELNIQRAPLPFMEDPPYSFQGCVF
jgi:hypothetical protein